MGIQAAADHDEAVSALLETGRAVAAMEAKQHAIAALEAVLSQDTSGQVAVSGRNVEKVAENSYTHHLTGCKCV